MKLKASGIGRLENKYRQNLLNMIDDIPPLSVMLTIIQEAMSPWEHGIDYQDVQKLYDAWIDEGNSQLELYQKISRSWWYRVFDRRKQRHPFWRKSRTPDVRTALRAVSGSS